MNHSDKVIEFSRRVGDYVYGLGEEFEMDYASVIGVLHLLIHEMTQGAFSEAAEEEEEDEED